MQRKSPRNPSASPRPVVVCLAGFSPAVVTETLYALAVLKRPRIVPERVYILTTEDAYKVLVTALLGKDGAIQRLVQEYGLPRSSLSCTPDDVILLRTRSGRPLPDIRSSADSVDAGEAISRFLQGLRTDPRIELHCSLAGGRKTMGALMALALQMTARPGDRLYHVLVSDPFEKIPEFFFPPRRPRRYLLDGKRVHSGRARIDLAELPLVRLGPVAESLGLDPEDLAQRAARLEAAMSRRFAPPRLILLPGSSTVSVNGLGVRLAPQEFALYMLYASLRAECLRCRRRPGPGCPACQPTDDEVFEHHRGRILSRYRECRPEGGDTFVQTLASSSQTAESKINFHEWLRQTRSRIKRKLRQVAAAGTPGAGAAIRRIPAGLHRGGNRRGLAIPPRSISIRAGPSSSGKESSHGSLRRQSRNVGGRSVQR